MRSPSPALVVSLVALAVALGGTGYAVTQLPRNSVGTAQLKKDAVTGAKVKARSLEASDFKPGQLPAGAPGATGAPGPQGERGPQGELGPSFAFTDSQVLGSPVMITTLTTVISHTVTLPRAGTLTGSVTGRLFIGSGSPGDSAMAFCQARMTPPGVNITQRMPSGTAMAGSGGADDSLMSLTFGYSVPAAGTYTLSVRCTREQLAGTPTVGLDRWDLSGVLAGS